ncbi:MAG: aminoacyl-tRNA hydrolase [bacterium]|nr:aminoacyl-tRNA hydrolase [bacterium]
MQDQNDSSVRLVVGLGNPGKRFTRTRHNIGFDVVEAAAKRWTATGPKAAFGGLVFDARPVASDGRTAHVVLLQPHTFMNCSGQAVRDIANFYKAEINDILIVLDDMALPTGKLRVREGGSAGGHNGLNDIIRSMGENSITRLRIGIGAPPEFMDSADYVLQRFDDSELETITSAVERGAQAVEDWVFNGPRHAMDIYNRDIGTDSDAPDNQNTNRQDNKNGT